VIADGDAAGKRWNGLPDGTRLGHIHLQVGDIAQAAAFYHDTLGFDVVAKLPSALFVSAGGYHHHIGLNTWHSRGANAAPAGYAGLRHFTIELADDAARAQVVERARAAGHTVTADAADLIVEDPWHGTIRLSAGAAR
jgi:catechol 2,3-dioxygenase